MRYIIFTWMINRVESVVCCVCYSAVLPCSGNVIVDEVVLIRNFSKDIGSADVIGFGIKVVLGYNPRSMTEWKRDRAHTRMDAIACSQKIF